LGRCLFPSGFDAGLTPQNSSGFPDENTFSTKVVDLSRFAERTVEIRFAYIHTNGSAFPQTDTSGGWFFDDITFQNIDELKNINTSDSIAGNSFSFTPSAEGTKSLQARPVAFANYPMEWGSVITVSAVTGTEPLFSRVINVSTRGKVLTGDSIMIAGFVVEGPEAMDVVIRGVGPRLSDFSIQGVLDDPLLRIFKGTTQIANNDNWSDNSPGTLTQHFGEVGAFGLNNPSADAAHRMTLTQGGHSAHLLGNSDGTGVAIVEVYDQTYRTDPNKATRLKNISTRGFTGIGDDIMIAGFFIEGNKNQRLLIRCAGPTLGNLGVAGTLADPELDVIRNPSTLLHSNDDWEDNVNVAEIISITAGLSAFPLLEGSTDSALLIELAPGSYSVNASGIDGGTGVVILEVYVLD